MKEKNYVNIPVKPKTHGEVMLFKIQTKAKNADEVVRRAIKALKQSLK